jgi:hypothetical protein
MEAARFRPAQARAGAGDFVDEELFGLADGLEVVAVGLEELAEVFGILPRAG